MHEFVEIFYCIGGTGIQEISGVSYPVVSGGFYLIDPHVPHQISTFSLTEHYDIIVRKSLWDNNPVCREFGQKLDGTHAVYFSPYDHQRASALIVMMEEESNLSQPSPAVLLHLFEVLISLAGRSGMGSKESAEISRRVSRPQIIDYVNKHCCEDITLKGIALLYGYNSSYLSRYFSEMCGMTFSEYLNRLRINRAKSLLKVTHFKVGEISRMIGYKGNSQLYITFSKECGMSPSRFRAEYHKSKIKNNIEEEGAQADLLPDDSPDKKSGKPVKQERR
jgi:AraC-like DNA-binding protein